jgi:probable DNA repair protein
MAAPTVIERSALFERLARGHDERVVVITPNRRLAQSLEAEFDRRQLAAGLGSWEAPDILPFDSWIERCYEDALYAEGGAELPVLLSPAAEQLLWEDAVRSSRWRTSVLSVPATAALAAQAWSLAHEWDIAGVLDVWPGNEDVEAFAAWRSHYRRRADQERFMDRARLPRLVASLLSEARIAAPKALVLYAFDLATPSQSDFLARCERAGVEVRECRPSRAPAKVSRVELESPRREIEHAARWARSRLERPVARDAAPASVPVRGRKGKAPVPGQGDLFGGATGAQASTPAAPRAIAVVVPDLQKRRAEVVRTFSRVLGPEGFNVSLAPPLASTPLVDAALAALEIAAGAIAFDRASRLLRSPFIAGAESEMASRARLDVALRRIAPPALSAMKLRALAANESRRRPGLECPKLCAALDALLEAARPASRAGPHEWARRYTDRLHAIGFPGERTLDSAEFQALARWRELIADFATLGAVAPAWTAAEAFACLRRLASETLFQPASGAAPVQVLGLLESAGLAFEHLWVCGVTDDAWPVATRPHPLIPPGLQKKAGIPQSTPERSLAVDAALTAAWREAAAEVVFSSARMDGDRELLASPLVSDVPLAEPQALDVPEYATLRDALFHAGRQGGALADRDDAPAPAVQGPVRGGTAILVDQAACPFRAFAHFRLEARELERPEPGLAAPERGQLLHAMMARLWRELKDQDTLRKTDPAALGAMIDEAAAHAVETVRARHPGPLEGRFAELERERLAAVALEWLEIERARAPFEVVRIEDPMTLAAGELQLQGRIDRMDRLLDGGGLAVIDYKTGANAMPSSWLGERPDDCQLPLYALAAADEDVRAVAFARLKVGNLGFAGYARERNLLPDVGPVSGRAAKAHGIDSWETMVRTWREQTSALGAGFASGTPVVDPKNRLATCERCDLQPLCRVHERLGTLDDGDEEAPE